MPARTNDSRHSTSDIAFTRRTTAWMSLRVGLTAPLFSAPFAGDFLRETTLEIRIVAKLLSTLRPKITDDACSIPDSDLDVAF